MIEIKAGVDTRIPVRLLNAATGAPLTGIAYTAPVTATIILGDGVTSISPTLNGSTWTELTTGAFSGSGTYLLNTGTGLNITGPCQYAVSAPGARLYVGSIKVVANEEVDTFTRLGAPAGASVSADIAASPAAVWNIARAAHSTTGDMGEALQIAYLVSRGHVKMNNTTKRIEVWNETDTAIKFEMSLVDLNNVATVTKPFERKFYP